MFRKTLVLACGLLATGASCASSFVCTVNVISPGAAGWLGYEGAVGVSLYSGPRCTGAIVGVRYLCSKGHTSASCAAGVEQSAPALLQSAAMLQNAMDRSNPVSGQGRRCNGGFSNNCWGNFVIEAP